MMHVLSADWYGGDLHILARNGDAVQDLQFNGDIHWTIGSKRTCIGRMTREGHVPCPVGADVTHDWQCGRCAPAWSACIFEPTAHGEGETCTLCQREHVVYLALYGGLPKVGMTSSSRAETRWREQGADAAFIIQRRPDRLQARETERTVAFLHGIPERRRANELVSQWTRPVPTDLIERRAAEWQAVLGERFDVEPLQHLEHPLPVLPARPELAPIEGIHKGRALGAKGNFLVYQAAAGPLNVGATPVRAIRRNDLVGRWLTAASE